MGAGRRHGRRDRAGQGCGSGGEYDFDIAYLAAVTHEDSSLAEFHGGSESGWMGTLNDFFTNEGFRQFTVKNGRLEDGDVIRVMYTKEGLGADIGGSWGNSDTTLKSLAVSEGVLSPEFLSGKAGGTYEYSLFIDGSETNIRDTSKTMMY